MTGWFKIFEDGFDGTKWGVDRLYAKHGILNFTIPACIPPGNYFLRAELSKSGVVVPCSMPHHDCNSSRTPPCVELSWVRPFSLLELHVF